MDEDWHAPCQAIYKVVNVRHPSGSSRGRIQWKVREVKEKGDAHYDQTSEPTGMQFSRTAVGEIGATQEFSDMRINGSFRVQWSNRVCWRTAVRKSR